MPSVDRTSFAGGWQPDQDEIGAPPTVCLRMDNLTLDELGTLSLRLGSTIVETLPTADCHVLYTAILNGTRLRFANAGANVYVNGGLLVNGTSAGDRAFASYRGQVFMSDPAGTGAKYDGATLRNWGIAMTGGAPTPVAGAADGVTLVTGAESEAPVFLVTEPVAGGTYGANQVGTANGAVFFTPDPTTHRAVVLKEFFNFNATAYTGGTPASDNDLLTLWVYVQEPTAVLSITVMVDVNSTGITPAFQTDYYYAQFTQDVSQLLNYLNPSFTVQAPGTVSYTQAEAMLRGSLINQASALLTITGGQWTQLGIVRGSFLRMGSTPGRDWTTVDAVQVVVQTTPADTTPVQVGLCNIAFEVANEVGSYQWAYQYGYQSAPGGAPGVGYVGLSAPSPYSAALQTQSANTTLTVPADSARDPQVNIVYLYRFVLNNYYQTASQTISPGNTGAIAILDPTGDVLALEDDLVLVTDILPPPAGVIAIAGPYYDRLFALTSSSLAMSMPINPDSFRTGQVIWEAGADETPLWCKKTFGGVYIGTTKDIYRVDGTAADLPDGTVDVVVSPLSIDHPPINTACAQDGSLLIYCASDGWRSVASAGSQSLVGNTSLLYAKQLQRYGVGPVNLKTGRFVGVVQQRQLVAITPEGVA